MLVNGLLTVGDPPPLAFTNPEMQVSLLTVGVADTDGVVEVPLAIDDTTSSAPTAPAVAPISSTFPVPRSRQ
jgi:hypothetical protein